MNWRNPFLITYLSVTVGGTAILGYLLYSAWASAQQADADYNASVVKLQQLQNKKPFPSAENNAKYVEYTKQYRAEYDKLIAQATGMQKRVEAITPQTFQDLLRTNVSQVEQAAKENNVALPEGFYLGFDQYRGTLPADNAAGPLARELAAIRVVIDQLITLRAKEITGIRRDTLPEEGGARVAENDRGTRGTTGGNNRPGAGNRTGGGGGGGGGIVSTYGFEVGFVADQAVTRSALDAIANAEQFFIIRSLAIQNSAQEGPEKGGPPVDPAAQIPQDPAAQPGQPPKPKIVVLAGRETLSVSLRIEMVTFNNLTTAR